MLNVLRRNAQKARLVQALHAALTRQARLPVFFRAYGVADTIDGKPLFEYQGPFRIVAPHDNRGARSIRMLQRLELVRLVK